MKITTVHLEKLKLMCTQAVSEELLDASCEIREDLYSEIARNFLVIVRGAVLAEKEPVERLEVKYPKDWKEAFKERWFPRWLLKCHPVEYTVRYIEARAIYPGFKPALPDKPHRIILQKL